MAESNRTCQGCSYLQGNECYQYQGTTNERCGLVTGMWYKIDDLIAALECAGTTTTSSTTAGGCNNCICLLVEGYNNTRDGVGNAISWFTYKLYKDSARTELLVERTLDEGINNIFVQYGPLDTDGPLYPEISAYLQPRDNQPFDSYGEELDLVITADEMIVYARSIPIPQDGTNTFPALPLLPGGRIRLYLFDNRFDTNPNEGQGIVAIGGNRLEHSTFTIKTTLHGGGIVGNPELNWPYVLDSSQDYVHTNFDTDDYGSHATSMDITTTGTNNEAGPLKVEYSFSADTSLDFTDTVLPGAAYEKTVHLFLEQAIYNDILIRFLQ